MVELNAVCTPEIIPQGPRQFPADGSILQALPQPLRIDKYDLWNYCDLEGEDPPLFWTILLGTGLQKGGQRIIRQNHRFLPASQLTVVAALEPGEVDGQGSGGGVQAQDGKGVDILGDNLRLLFQPGEHVASNQKCPGRLFSPGDGLEPGQLPLADIFISVLLSIVLSTPI